MSNDCEHWIVGSDAGAYGRNCFHCGLIVLDDEALYVPLVSNERLVARIGIWCEPEGDEAEWTEYVYQFDEITNEDARDAAKAHVLTESI